MLLDPVVVTGINPWKIKTESIILI